MKIKLQIRMILALSAIGWISSCSTSDSALNNPEPLAHGIQVSDRNTGDNDSDELYYSKESTVNDVLNDPAFGSFGRLLFPVDRPVSPSMTLEEVSTTRIYMWYPYIQADKTVEILNFLHSQASKGETIFHSIYSTEEIALDPSKADTGIFVFRGDPGSPFAITNAGGGFAYVGAMHDSFPHSLELCKAGYTAFALIYRPDDPYSDLARAITFIRDNSEALGVKEDNYSLWGGSAGARMAAVLGNKGYLNELTGDTDIPQAAAVIMQYTGYSSVSPLDAPTYNCVGTNDGIAPWQVMQSRLERLSSMGIPTEFHAYEGLSHGFGIGTGTVAEGWVNDAIEFWKSNMKSEPGTGVDQIFDD